MEESLDEWHAEYERLSEALGQYWIPADQQGLTEAERIFSDLCYYWCAALDNSGDVFGYVHFILDKKADFAAIGADGTLRALELLMPYFVEQQLLRDDIAKGKYWWETKDRRSSAELQAEGVNEFARLLLAYAQKNLEKRRQDWS